MHFGLLSFAIVTDAHASVLHGCDILQVQIHPLETNGLYLELDPVSLFHLSQFK